MTWWPDLASTCSAIWVHSVPVGRYTAACLPVSSATRSSSRLTVGSSPSLSSPTSAAAIARRIASVGRVTVSDRRSTRAAICPVSSRYSRSPPRGSRMHGPRCGTVADDPTGNGAGPGRRELEASEAMKALVKARAEAGLWVEDVPVPAVGRDDVLIRVLRTGVCGTDLHIYEWDGW